MMARSHMIRVLMVEDSIVQREILRRILRADGAFTIVAEARNGKEAVRMVEEHTPDVVLMDIHMPDMNGVEATREIMRRFPVPIVIASATLKKNDVDMGLEALHAGAVTVIDKPEGAVLLNLDKMAENLCAQILSASKLRLRPLALSDRSKNRKADDRGAICARTETIEVIGICTSTGGPHVLVEILTALPRPFSTPILLVQHITQGFEAGFASWLSEQTGQPVGLVTNGQRLSSGTWMAANGRHLTLESSRSLSLVDPKAGDIHCPSGNPLFKSLAKTSGAGAAGMLLTGMGDDGATGLLELKQAGGTTVIQDEASSFIWGMPKAGKELNAAIYELNPREIADLMTRMERGRR